MRFVFLDPNMNKLEVPDGLWPQELFVSSIEKNRHIESIDGIPRLVDYGYTHGNRDVKLTFITKHRHGDYDYNLMISEINDFFDNYPYLYIAHESVPTRVLKIAIDKKFEPKRISRSKYAKLEINAEIIGLPYWKTIYTTKDIEENEFTVKNDMFGLADDIHQEYTRYTFDKSNFSIWNGGNITVNPRFMDLNITVLNADSDGQATIKNKTTDESFVFN
ncbi:phage tail domain-containing protein, partial [Staphylococcus xylosus]